MSSGDYGDCRQGRDQWTVHQCIAVLAPLMQQENTISEIQPIKNIQRLNKL